MALLSEMEFMNRCCIHIYWTALPLIVVAIDDMDFEKKVKTRIIKDFYE